MNQSGGCHTVKNHRPFLAGDSDQTWGTIDVAESTAAQSEAVAEPEPEFELTPEILQHENRRNDLILAAGVLLVAFFLGFFKEAGADLWLWLKTGKLIAEGFPALPRVDTFTYTCEGAAWINPEWLFHWASYLLFDRLGPASLTIAKSILVVLAAGLLLCIRHQGPTLWGNVVLVLLVLIAVSARLSYNPDIPAMALFAAFLFCLFQAKYRGRFWMVYLSVPIAALWANLGLGFFFVPAVLLLVAVGEGFQLLFADADRFRSAARPPGREIQFLLAAALCLAAGLATPYGWDGLKLRYEWFATILPKVPNFDRDASGWGYIGAKDYLNALGRQALTWDRWAWTVLVVLAVVAQAFNSRRFNVARALVTVFAVGVALAVDRYIIESSMLLAVVTALSAQEYFLDRFGSETRMDRGWLVWSQGGRAATIIVVFLAILAAFTGRIQGLIGRFGAGIEEDRYMTDATRWFEKVHPKGQGFAFINRIASYRVWATPERKNFVDSRWQVVQSALGKFSQARRALDQDKPDEWKPIFQEYGITHVLVDPSQRRLHGVLARLMSSPDFVPLFISDQVVIVGLAGESVDKELFAKNRIRTNEMVFREKREMPRPTDRFVFPPGIIDSIWRTRWKYPPEMVAGTVYSGLYPSLERPGTSFQAVSLLRNAVSASPDNPESYLQLGIAYDQVFRLESLQYALAREQAIEAMEKAKTEKASGKPGPSGREAEAKPKEQAAPAKGNAAPGKVPPPPPKENGGDEKAQRAKDAASKSAAAKADEKSAAAENSDGAKAAQEQPAPQAIPRTFQSPPSRFLLPMRHYQIAAAYRNAILAGADDARAHISFFEFCRTNEMYDLALRELERALEYPLDERAAAFYREQALPHLRAEVDRRTAQFDAMIEEAHRQGPAAGDLIVEKATLALQLNLPGLAVEQLEAVSPFGPDYLRSAPLAIAVYLMVGMPERADNLLRDVRDQRLLQPGEWDWWSAQIRIINGQYVEARDLIEHAIAEVRASRVSRALQGIETRVRGSLLTEPGDLLSIPFEANAILADLEREAVYQVALGLLRIEMGEPDLAIKVFKKCLEIFPRHALRSVIEMYWRLITKDPIPPAPAPYDPESEIAVRYAPAEGSAGSAKKDSDGAPKSARGEVSAPIKPPSTSAPSKGEEKKAAPKTDSPGKDKKSP